MDGCFSFIYFFGQAREKQYFAAGYQYRNVYICNIRTCIPYVQSPTQDYSTFFPQSCRTESILYTNKYCREVLLWFTSIFYDDFFSLINLLLKGRLADELRQEQDHGMAANKAAKSLHSQSSELQARLDDIEEQALRHGRKIIQKLEERVRSLEGELCKSTIQGCFLCRLFFRHF